MQALLNHQEYALLEYSLTIEEQLNERSTCSFSVKSDINTLFEKGTPIVIRVEKPFEEEAPNEDVFIPDEEVEEEGEDILNSYRRWRQKEVVEEVPQKSYDIVFAGFVNSSSHKDYVAQNVRVHQIDAVDNHYLLDKRVWVRGFTAATAGHIVRTMVDEMLHEEGITYTDMSIAEGLEIPYISFNYEPCIDIMDKLCEACAFVWHVDKHKVLHFYSSRAVDNNTVITDDLVLNQNFKITNKNNQYRNRQYVKGGMGETATITQIFKGDGSTQAFALGYRLSKKPKIWVKEGSGAWRYVYEDFIVEKTYDKADAEFLYAKNDNIILQNPLHKPYTANDQIKVEYVGTFPIMAITTYEHEINRVKQIEAGGTGIVEHVSNETDLATIQDAVQSANGKLSKYAVNTWQVEFLSRFKVASLGEVIDFEMRELTDSGFLVDNIETSDDSGIPIYRYNCVKGALIDSWTKLLGNGLRKPSLINYTDLAEQETVVISREFTKTWQEWEKPNPFHKMKPSSTLYPSNDYYDLPMFRYGHRVRFVEIVSEKGGVVLRNTYTQQSNNRANTITTHFFIDFFQAVGTWGKLRFYGGWEASFEIGSGILLEEVDFNFTKDQLEGLQIIRTDIKGW